MRIKLISVFLVTALGSPLATMAQQPPMSDGARMNQILQDTGGLQRKTIPLTKEELAQTSTTVSAEDIVALINSLKEPYVTLTNSEILRCEGGAEQYRRFVKLKKVSRAGGLFLGDVYIDAAAIYYIRNGAAD